MQDVLSLLSKGVFLYFYLSSMLCPQVILLCIPQRLLWIKKHLQNSKPVIVITWSVIDRN